MYVLLNPNDINGYLSRLDILVKFGMRSEAYADMEKASKLKASSPSEYLQRSRIRYLMKDTIGCLQDLNDCISQSPSFIEAYYLRGKYHYEFGNNNLAIQDLNIYLLSNEKDADAFVIRGECYARQNEFSIAVSDYSKAISIDGINPTYYFDRGFFYLQLQEYQNAQKDFIKAIAYDHQDIRLAYFNLGISSYRLGQKDEACEQWRKSENVGMDYINKYCK
jgi:tetratricopeptide (TPR) repeat protein